ncbi:hypothetical protein DCS_05593 [Drechmeria coniospora]|uniref:Uncharacterized protein n=1 Tax=Drechmeria coniospora TaxID=98403 RepID=A0A151GNA3_DRECN|nr:hypothetical protein DCS_05593 [Drechmeria coniospora]KYK58576.1 hypothetical protein DCS_05593 [Drechmeria coniospora]
MLPDTRRRVRPLVALPVEQEQDEKDSGFVVAIVAWARGATQPGAMTDAGAFSSAHVENLATCSDVIDLQVTKTPRVAEPNAGMASTFELVWDRVHPQLGECTPRVLWVRQVARLVATGNDSSALQLQMLQMLQILHSGSAWLRVVVSQRSTVMRKGEGVWRQDEEGVIRHRVAVR